MINEKPVQGRSCGECTFCCTAMQVEELKKSNWATCEHLISIGPDFAGCGIYADRPKSCRTFSCLWLAGLIGGENHRPDKSGVMITSTESNVLGTRYTFTAWLTKEDGFTDKVKYLCKKIVDRCGVLMVKSPSGRIRFMGQRQLIEKLKERYDITA
jgi:hypothetical protein